MMVLKKVNQKDLTPKTALKRGYPKKMPFQITSKNPKIGS
jgi:hypothetical protein